MRVMLTGAAGFLGSHLAEKLLQDGHEVVGVDNFVTGAVSNLQSLVKHEVCQTDVSSGKFDWFSLTDPPFYFVYNDVSDLRHINDEGRSWLTRHCEVDAVLHFASPASPIDYFALPIETLRVNAFGCYQMLEVARANNATFLLASTSEVYGDPLMHPQNEQYWGNVNPIGPRSVYDEAKRFAESMTVAYRSKYGVDTKIVRIFNTYGPRMRINDGRVVSNFIVQSLRGQPLTVYGDGTQTRSFCYVDDEVDGIIRLLNSDEPGPVNIGNPAEFSIMELAEIVQQEVGCDAGVTLEPLPTDDPKVRRPDITLAKQALGWSPKVSLRDGVRLTVPYFENALAGSRYQ